MARKTVRVCDSCGQEVAEGKGAVVRAKYTDARRGSKQAAPRSSHQQPVGACMQPGGTIAPDALLTAKPEPMAAITNAIASNFLTLTSSVPRREAPSLTGEESV